MTLSLFVHTDSERSERTGSTPALRPMTGKAREGHSVPTRATSVAVPECVRLDLCRWENEGGALIETESARSATVDCTANKNFPMDSQTVQHTNLASPNSRLAGRSACRTPTALQIRDASCSMRLSHVHLKVRDLTRSIPFYTSVLGLRLSEHTGRHAFLATGTEHHSIALEEIGARAAAPSRHAVGMAHLAFEVPDRAAFVAAHDRLWKASIPISCADKGISWTMRFEDPDGNEIEVYLDRRKALGGTPLWEGRWHAFKIPKPYAPSLPAAPRRGSPAARVAHHEQSPIEGAEGKRRMCSQ